MLLVAFVSVMTAFVSFVVENERILVVEYLVATRLVPIVRKRATEDGAAAMVRRPLCFMLNPGGRQKMPLVIGGSWLARRRERRHGQSQQ